MERPLLVIFWLVGYAWAYEWHFGNDNPNYDIIEYLQGKIWPLGKTTRINLSVPPCMLIRYVWVAVINLISNPSVTYNKDSYMVMIEYGLLASNKSEYHVVARGMRDPACGGAGTGGGDPRCPPPSCPAPSCPIPNCAPANCVLPTEPPRCPPAPECQPIYCPPPSCPSQNCPRAHCPQSYCPLPQCPPSECYAPYVVANCPRPYCPSCPISNCPQFNGYHMLSARTPKKPNARGKTAEKSKYGRERDPEVVFDYINGRDIYNVTSRLKKIYGALNENDNIMDHAGYDFEDDDNSEDESDSDEAVPNVKPSNVKEGRVGEKHDLMLFIVSDKKIGKQEAAERHNGYGHVKKIGYTKNNGYNKGTGHDGDDVYDENSGEATRNVKLGYITDVKYGWGNENAKDTIYRGSDRDDGGRGHSGESDQGTSDSDRDWGYGYDANVFYPGEESRGRGSEGNDRGSSYGGRSALCVKSALYRGVSPLCRGDQDGMDGEIVGDSGYERVGGQVGYGGTGQFLP